MSVDLDKLRALAQAATPGPWRIGVFPLECAGPGDVVVDNEIGAYTILAGNSNFPDDAKANAAFSAAANPAAILELLAAFDHEVSAALAHERRHQELLREVADLRAALAVRDAVPDGWQLVPVDSTPEMWEAGLRCGIGGAWSYAGCWRAMLAAAPRLTLDTMRIA